MSFFKDMFAVFKKRELAFLESCQESEHVHSFVFEKPKDLSWNAGQYGLFTPTHKKIKNGTKPFSISSAPAENVVRLTMRVGDQPSPYKTAMTELKKGMTIKMSGPIGAFNLADNRPSLLIAGGIGITPFRSMLKQLETDGKKASNPIRLLYMDSNHSYLFREEMDRIAKKTSVGIAYLADRNDLRLETEKFIASHKDNANYYIAGPKSIVDSVADELQKSDVSKGNIKKDAFWGYG